MIAGFVAEDGVPTISLEVGGTDFRAVVDTGFNGGLELPLKLKETVNAHPIGERWAELAAG